MKMKHISHGCGLLVSPDSLYILYSALCQEASLALYTPPMGFLALWLLAGFGQWEAEAGDLEWGQDFLPVPPSLQGHCGLAVAYSSHLATLSRCSICNFWCILILHQGTAPQYLTSPGSALSMVAFPNPALDLWIVYNLCSGFPV